MVPFPFLDFRGKVGGKAGGSSQRTNWQRREDMRRISGSRTL